MENVVQNKKSRKSQTVKKVVVYVVMIVIALIMIFPFYWQIIISFRTRDAITSGNLSLLPSALTLDNYKEVLKGTFIVLCFAEEVDIAIKEYAVVDSKYGKIYAFETDGYGNYNLMDDANVPSLLSLPYLDYCEPNDEIYLNTRNFIFSEDNKYYYKGKFADGVGSPHTPENYIWHIAIVMRILTSVDQEEKRKYYQILLDTDAEKGFMHEGFNKDNPKEYTREWFAWANTLFALATFDIYSNV